MIPNWTRWAGAAAIYALLSLWAPAVGAHTRSQSFSTWRIAGEQVRATYSVKSREVTRLPLLEGAGLDLERLITSHVRDRLQIRSGDQRCPALGPPRGLASQRGYQRVEMRFHCPRGHPLSLEVSTFVDLVPSHVHFARVSVDGGPPLEHLFTDARRFARVSDGPEAAPSAARGASIGGYVWLGVEHILGGVDHLAFLLALLLLSRGLRDVVFIVTGFTLGHSFTLTLAVLGWVTPDVVLVEALIGFTIALVAAENAGVSAGATRRIGQVAGVVLLTLAGVSVAGIGPSPIALLGLALFAPCYMSLVDSPELARRVRPSVTALFGLVHGFGFASMLLEAGVPDDRLVSALFGFNIGVELGQLGIVAAMWWVARAALSRWTSFPRGLALDAVSAALCALGLFWFFGRAYASA